jgi:hypothetical protein
MKLSEQDATLFFELTWALHFYLNQKLEIVPTIQTLEQYEAAPLEDKVKVRAALYQQPEWIDAFLQDNPQNFSEEKLAIVHQWKQFVSDDFYVERMLKKYAIFIGKNDAVYGVVGLLNDFDELFHPSELPRIVRTVLLPFKDKVVYDGVFQRYNILFGSGISRNLKDIYLTAKQQGKIIESLAGSHAQPVTSAPGKPQKDWRPELEELLTKAQKLRGGSGQPAIYGPVFSLIKASLEMGQVAVAHPDDDEQLWKLLGKVEQALRKVERSIYR